MAEPLPQPQHQNKPAAEAAEQMRKILSNYLNGGRGFTGVITFDLHCRNGGFGNLKAFVRKELAT
jgi:hypothetical protein